MNNLKLSIVHRMPACYRWLSDKVGSKVEPALHHDGENALIGLKLLTDKGDTAWYVMDTFCKTLHEIDMECFVVEYEDEPCLFVHHQDEPAAICCLKNVGVAIAETFSHVNPF